MAFPTEADLARLRYENAYVALLERAQRAEKQLAEAIEHLKTSAEQIKKMTKQLDQLKELLKGPRT